MKTFSPRAKQIIGILAQDEARILGSRQILPEHVILALLKSKEGIGYSVFEKLLLNPEELVFFLEKFFIEDSKQPTLDSIPPSRRYQQLLDIADIESSSIHNEYIGTEHILLAAIREESSVTSRFFAISDYSMTDVRIVVSELQKTIPSSISIGLAENIIDSVFNSLFESGDEKNLFAFGEKNKKAEKTQEDNQKEKKSMLAEYGRDLTKLAGDNKCDPLVGREKEVQRMIQILSRRSKNNPVLTGEPGVGKTAIVEGLAARIASGNVPYNLLKKKIISFDVAAIVAGTKYRGEFEERMKKLLAELQEKKDVILFIDELHIIIGAGGGESSMDASNIIKPALSRGEIQLIGATTTKEYTKHIEKDSALERRFQVIKVEEPTEDETCEILDGIRHKYEKYHNVVYSDDVIPTIVKLSKRYLPEKVLPDKAIDIMDEAGAVKKINQDQHSSEFTEFEIQKKYLENEKKNLIQNQDYDNAAAIRDKVIDLKRKISIYSDLLEKNTKNPIKVVNKKDIENVISEMTGIPIEQLTTSESERIINMEKELHNTVIGQNEAVSIISGAIRRSRAGISSPKHPVGSFMFLGPTGVGKTQLAKALTKYLFGSEEALIRIDMSDFMEKHTASRLVGAPPGYVGYEEGGILTEKVRRHPYSVVLFDEIEKAHPDVFNLMLQLLEEGELSDNLGHTVNFRNTVIIMTSNAGARQITNEGRVGFGLSSEVLSYEEIKSGAMNELKKIMNPELINRIDDIIIFNALTKEEIKKVLEIQLNELKERLKDKNITFNISSEAENYLIENGYNPSMGARPMKRLIRKSIEDPLAMEILLNKGDEYNIASITFENGKISVKLEKESVEIKTAVIVK